MWTWSHECVGEEGGEGETGYSRVQVQIITNKYMVYRALSDSA